MLSFGQRSVTERLSQEIETMAKDEAQERARILNEATNTDNYRAMHNPAMQCWEVLRWCEDRKQWRAVVSA